MSSSMKEQLLRLGLVKDKEKREPPSRQRDTRPPRPPRPPAAARPRAAPPRAPAPTAQPPPGSRQAREMERQRAARQNRLREAVEVRKLDDPQAEIKHYYSTGKKIKGLYITEAQQSALLRGEIVIVIAQGKGRLVASGALPALREIDPDLRLVDPSRVEDGAAAVEDDDVPDDLRW